jgi:ubiquinone/menaquinone biosynthesis C-methylase UbiE
MMDSSVDWHSRFSQQANWTRDLRQYLFERAGLQNAWRVLDVGCGTGVIENELQNNTSAEIYGLDIDPSRLILATRHAPRASFIHGDALQLPFPATSFDITFCHFLLLWVASPEKAITEMKRVTRPGGFVLALAEPDYGGRIDYPEELEMIGHMQAEALRRQGADPLTGRKVASIFNRTGFQVTETGLMGGQWNSVPSKQIFDLEWSVIQSDLENTISSENLATLRTVDWSAWQNGERILFVPTFYALGRV